MNVLCMTLKICYSGPFKKVDYTLTAIGLVAPDRVRSIGQTDLNCFLMLNYGYYAMNPNQIIYLICIKRGICYLNIHQCLICHKTKPIRTNTYTRRNWFRNMCAYRVWKIHPDRHRIYQHINEYESYISFSIHHFRIQSFNCSENSIDKSISKSTTLICFTL